MTLDPQLLGLSALIISALSFFLSFTQVLIQRVHNKKSVRPIGQVDVGDWKDIMYIYVVNNGIGPMIVKELKFLKNNNTFIDIIEVLDLDPTSYNHVSINKDVSKTLLPGSNLVVAELKYTKETEAFKVELRKKLAKIILTVVYEDIYSKQYEVVRDFKWFARHLKNDNTD